jgi:hypothetical protein
MPTEHAPEADENPEVLGFKKGREQLRRSHKRCSIATADARSECSDRKIQLLLDLKRRRRPRPRKMCHVPGQLRGNKKKLKITGQNKDKQKKV